MLVCNVASLGVVLLLGLAPLAGARAAVAVPGASTPAAASSAPIRLPYTLDGLIDRLLHANPPVPQPIQHFDAIFEHPLTHANASQTHWWYLGPLLTRDGVLISQVEARPSGLGDKPDVVVMLLVTIDPATKCASLAELRSRYGLNTLRLTSDVPPQRASGGWGQQYAWGNFGVGFNRIVDRCSNGFGLTIMRWPGSACPVQVCGNGVIPAGKEKREELPASEPR